MGLFGLQVTFFLFTSFLFVYTAFFHKVFGGSGSEIGERTRETSDGGYIQIGNTDSYGSGNSDIFLAKYDAFGNMEWMKTYGTAYGNENGYDVRELNDTTGYIMTGSIFTTTTDMLVAKIFKNGSINWAKAIGQANSEYGFMIRETNESNFVVVGVSDSWGSGQNEWITIKLDSSGDVIWTCGLGGVGNDMSRSIDLTSDGGYVIGGYYHDGSSVKWLLSKIDSLGKKTWTKILGGTSNDYAEGTVRVVSDGGFVMSGSYSSAGGYGDRDFWIVKFNHSGEVEWDRLIGNVGTEEFRDLTISTDGNFVACGSASDSAIVVKVHSSNGSIIWASEMNTLGTDICKSVSATSDGGVVVSGESSGYIFISKLDENGKNCNWTDWTSSYSTKSLGLSSSPIGFPNQAPGLSSVAAYPTTVNISTSLIYGCPTECRGEDCPCPDGYFGPYCNDTTCFGIISNLSDSVCSGHGSCFVIDTCSCKTDYFGLFCNITQCYGILANESKSCYGHGKCISTNNCSCNDGYDYQPDCSDWYCFNISRKNESEVCSEKGVCISHNNCSCFTNYTGETCGNWSCFSVKKDEDGVCFNHGNCYDHDSCNCTGNYTLKDCSGWTCDGKIKSSQLVCSNHGECISMDNCSCESDSYKGIWCEDWKCGNEWNDDVDNVCGSHGYCISSDTCFCLNGYSQLTYGSDCTEWSCGTYEKNNNEVCNQHGTCVLSHKCDCTGDYFGDLCEKFLCGGYESRLPTTCSGSGKCLEPNLCECDTGFAGANCEINVLVIAVASPLAAFGILSLFLCVVFVFICFACLLCLLCVSVCCIFSMVLIGTAGFSAKQAGKLKKFGTLKNIDILLEEQKLEDDTSVAHIRMNKDLFSVDFKDIKFESILGEGGSNSVVYKAKWRNQAIAFKCFKTRHVCGSQNDFDEFEREVNVLSSVSHPFIIRFFGACLSPPRVGILMEFCINGDLNVFLLKYLAVNEKSYPVLEKLRMSIEIATSLDYLHSIKVIHRDMKLENVLVDANESTKLMDFGLSKIVDRMSMNKTKKVGTSIYMPPEVYTSGKYDEKCDVFSFAIMLFIIFTEIWEPYKKKINVEAKVAHNPNYRPNFSEIDIRLKNESVQLRNCLRDIIMKCLDHNSSVRYSCIKIFELLKDVYDKEKEEGSLLLLSPKSSKDSEKKTLTETKDDVFKLDQLFLNTKEGEESKEDYFEEEEEDNSLKIEKMKEEMEKLRKANKKLEEENLRLKDQLKRLD